MNPILALTALTVLSAEPTVDDIVQRSFKDATFVARVESSNQRELAKIKKEFGTQYRIKETKFWIEEPHRLRIEAKIEDTTVLYIVSGATRFYKIPRINMTKTENNERAPGKRQTFMDFGIFTPSMFADPFQATFVRIDRATGDYVFDIMYNQKKYDDEARYRVWIDPQKRYTTKREWFARTGKQYATFLYENPVLKGGVWFPTRLIVKNVEGKVGGVTVFDNLTVNNGIADSMFQFK